MLFKKYIKRLRVSELLAIVFMELAGSWENWVSGGLNIGWLKFILIYGNIKAGQKKGTIIF